MTPPDSIRRREALLAIGGLGAAAWGATRLPAELTRSLSIPEAQAAGTCVLTREVTEGPYHIDNSLTRRNVRAGRAGLPLILYFTVQDVDTCRAIPGADVEIWHSDARGNYSGVNDSLRYLRGHQRANALGRVRFDTIYPGWYRGRTPHIHLKVHVGGEEVHTGQVFFSDAVSRVVYRTSAYRTRGQADTNNSEDNIYTQAGRSRALLRLARRRNASGYTGTITLAVRT